MDSNKEWTNEEVVLKIEKAGGICQDKELTEVKPAFFSLFLYYLYIIEEYF